MEKPELVAADRVLCKYLQEIDGHGGGVAHVQVDSLVQSFRDGSTRVLCEAMENDKCSKKKDGICHFKKDKI